MGSTFCAFPSGSVFSCGSGALFTGSTNIIFSNFFFKTGSHGTIYIFKNYFAIIFLIFDNKYYPNRPEINSKCYYHDMTLKISFFFWGWGDPIHGCDAIRRPFWVQIVNWKRHNLLGHGTKRSHSTHKLNRPTYGLSRTKGVFFFLVSWID